MNERTSELLKTARVCSKSSRRRDARQPFRYTIIRPTVSVRVSSRPLGGSAGCDQTGNSGWSCLSSSWTYFELRRTLSSLTSSLPPPVLKWLSFPPVATRGAAFIYQVLTGLLSVYSYCDKVLKGFEIVTSWFSSSVGEKTSELYYEGQIFLKNIFPIEN